MEKWPSIWEAEGKEVGGGEGRGNQTQWPQGPFSSISFVNPGNSPEWNLSTGQVGKLKLLGASQGRLYPSSCHCSLIRPEVTSQDKEDPHHAGFGLGGWSLCSRALRAP